MLVGLISASIVRPVANDTGDNTSKYTSVSVDLKQLDLTETGAFQVDRDT